MQAENGGNKCTGSPTEIATCNDQDCSGMYYSFPFVLLVIRGNDVGKLGITICSFQSIANGDLMQICLNATSLMACATNQQKVSNLNFIFRSNYNL